MHELDKRSRMAKYLPIVGMIWLVALVCFVWGAAMVRYQIFPYRTLKPILKEIVAFWRGHPLDKRPSGQRLWAGLTVDPFAFAMTPSAFPMELQLRPVDTSFYQGPNVQFLDNAQYYSDGSLKEYFLIYGSFGFEDTNWGAILVSYEGQVLRTWSIKPDEEEYEYPGPHIGLALSKTGDLATNKNGVLTSYSWCGKKNWEAEWKKQPERHDFDSVLGYDYHHDITYHEGRFYSFLGPEIVSVDEKTGNIIERIHAVDLIRWARDQDLTIFDARFKKDYTPNELNKENLANLTIWDPFHLNKVDVLSHDLASSFDIFEKGDMLVSMRELNLVFILRPKTSKILWYRYGLTSRQHDATFQRGYISIFEITIHLRIREAAHGSLH